MDSWFWNSSLRISLILFPIVERRARFNARLSFRSIISRLKEEYGLKWILIVIKSNDQSNVYIPAKRSSGITLGLTSAKLSEVKLSDVKMRKVNFHNQKNLFIIQILAKVYSLVLRDKLVCNRYYWINQLLVLNLWLTMFSEVNGAANGKVFIFEISIEREEVWSVKYNI